MTAGATGCVRGSVRRPASSHIPLDELLAPKVTAALREAVLSEAKITPQFVRDLNDRFGIGEMHGVSTRRLRGYLERLRAGADVGKRRGSRPKAPDPAVNEKLEAIRRRQVSVAGILDATFGHLGDCNPDLWERRAYLMLVGLVYERLATNEEELATDELVALAKVLAEHRRVDARRHASGAEHDTEPSRGHPDSRLPDHFGDMVRQVYGTNFQNPGRDG